MGESEFIPYTRDAPIIPSDWIAPSNPLLLHSHRQFVDGYRLGFRDCVVTGGNRIVICLTD